MGASFHPRIQTTVLTMEALWLYPAEDVSWKKIWPLLFWDAGGILMVYYLQKGQTINVIYYPSLLRHLIENIKVKHRGKHSLVVFITKTCLFKYTENLTTKK